jgi:NADH-quinone oxidoreductase subunit M
MPDLNAREWLAIAPLLLLMVWMGVAPMTFLPPVSASNRATLDRSRVNFEQTVQVQPLHPAARVKEVAGDR